MHVLVFRHRSSGYQFQMCFSAGVIRRASLALAEAILQAIGRPAANLIACTDRLVDVSRIAFGRARELFRSTGLPLNGAMISVYTRFQIKKGVFDYISGFIIPDDVTVPSSSGLKVWSIPPSRSLRVEHVGSYRHLGNGWSVANQVARYRKMKQQRCGTYEIYRTTPPSTPDTELRTDIYLPLK